MTSKHTPGPWKTGFIMDGDRWVGPDFDQPLVCRIEDERDEFHANARLIAAAPDLLEALKDARAQLEAYELDRTGETYNSPTINAAIAKAEGRL